jgi:hypothetical protein
MQDISGTKSTRATCNLFKLLAEGVDVPEKLVGLEALGVLAKVLRQ